MPRLFVALRPPGAVRDQLLDLGEGVPGARWQDEDQLHVTLRFVGEVDRPVGENLAACLAALHAPAPVVRLAGVGAFDGKRSGAQLWAGLSPAEPLHRLHAKVEGACRRAGLPPDGRAYRPHLTLARLSRATVGSVAAQRWLADHAGLASKAFLMPHLILFESVLGGQGARYETIARWPLDREGEGR